MKKIPFWFDPRLISLFWFMVLIASFALPESAYLEMFRSRKYLDVEAFGVGVLGLLSFVLGIQIGMVAIRPQSVGQSGHRWREFREAAALPKVRLAVSVVFAITLGAYVLWLGPTLNPTVLAQTVQGGGGAIAREYGRTIPGVTTLTQLSIVLAIISSYVIFSNSFSGSTKRFYLIILTTLIALSFYRSFIWRERLAAFELIVASGLVWAAVKYKGQVYIRYLPIIGIFLAIFLFGFFEYFRSWEYYRYEGESVAVFSAKRFLSYYVSSFNNMALAYHQSDPTWEPRHTLEFIYLFPVPFASGLRDVFEEAWSSYMLMMARHANPEFNLFSAIGLSVKDFGAFGGSASLAVFGLLTGLLYRAFQRGVIFGLLAYPAWMIGLLEFGRLLYFSTGRAFPVWIGALVFSVLFYQIAKRRKTNR
ncbi:conserved membrane hypothetical protein [Oceanicaulis sp. 350]|nr:conserved membrane hypothetical protein [Oceanicaulis sp. 350]